MSVALTVNGEAVRAAEGMTLLEAAERAGIYIPRLCYHPALGSSHGLRPAEAVHRAEGQYRHDGSRDEFPGCRLCLVEIEGQDALCTACDTVAEAGMVVRTETAVVKQQRCDRLLDILRDHPHACLLCAQREGCSRTQCSSNVPAAERCCELLGHCELQKVADYVGIRSDIPRYVFRDLPRQDEPLFDRDYNLCIACLRCVRACDDLRGVAALGYVFHDCQAVVGTTGDATLAGSECRFCGACIEVCPTGALTDRAREPGDRAAALVPCLAGCPAGLDIPRYLRLIAAGRDSDALAVIRARLPFPGILGRVCFHPCETVCRRGQLNQPMAICDLKWFAADHGQVPPPQADAATGKRVAVVGSGPAGLAAAYYLALAGHGVTVFEAEAERGGMLRYAVPDYRLTPADLEADLTVLDTLGVEFRTGVRVGQGVALSALADEFDALFLGTGATHSKRLPLAGASLTGVAGALDFLKRVKQRQLTSLAGRVVVIGGGNVAMDVARTALRLGARRVQLACLESEAELPAHAWEVVEAREEGVEMHLAWGPRRITGTTRVTGLELVRCASVWDRDGNFAPRFDEQATKTLAADTVILAIGQSADTAYLEASGLAAPQGLLPVDPQQQTASRGIFAGGELARGPASVVEAVADGAAAAAAIDRYLGGDGEIYPALPPPAAPDPHLGRGDGFAHLARVAQPQRPAGERARDFAMVAACYRASAARQEAARCLRCDLRLAIAPVTLPPEQWLALTAEQVARVPAAGGVFQLLDQAREIIVIKGTPDLRADLEAKLGSDTAARYFGCEPDPMYSQRESELIQQYLQQHGRMPPGDGDDDDLDDLF